MKEMPFVSVRNFATPWSSDTGCEIVRAAALQLSSFEPSVKSTVTRTLARASGPASSKAFSWWAVILGIRDHTSSASMRCGENLDHRSMIDGGHGSRGALPGTKVGAPKKTRTPSPANSPIVPPREAALIRFVVTA